MAFIPHTEDDIKSMLKTIGANSIADLFDEIPLQLKLNRDLDVPSRLNEMQITRLMQARAQKDDGYLNFIGAGAYEHHIPAAVWELTSRGEFLTAYTPYQAEASQGGLQLIYEYQTMIASLTGMDVSNASLYGGATALAEAVLMAVRSNKEIKAKNILYADSLSPFYFDTVDTLIGCQGIRLTKLSSDAETGCVDKGKLNNDTDEEFTALIIQQPNFFGCLESVDELTDWAHEKNMFVIAVVNPTSLALLKPPGEWGEQGADIVCGEGQPLGVPLASGGPYFGFMACKKEFVRQMPGRIVGRTIDKDGKEGFTLTLQAREQHIRRGKAKSNICTNQGLLVTAATIYMSLMGPEGLRQVALASHNNTKKLVERLTKLPGVKLAFSSPYFHEVVLRFEKPVKDILLAGEKQKVLAGFKLTEHYPQLGNALLLCATEIKTDEDIDRLAAVISA